jgi:hypothetical protein
VRQFLPSFAAPPYPEHIPAIVEGGTFRPGLPVLDRL